MIPQFDIVENWLAISYVLKRIRYSLSIHLNFFATNDISCTRIWLRFVFRVEETITHDLYHSRRNSILNSMIYKSWWYIIACLQAKSLAISCRFCKVQPFCQIFQTCNLVQLCKSLCQSCESCKIFLAILPSCELANFASKRCANTKMCLNVSWLCFTYQNILYPRKKQSQFPKTNIAFAIALPTAYAQQKKVF